MASASLHIHILDSTGLRSAYISELCFADLARSLRVPSFLVAPASLRIHIPDSAPFASTFQTLQGCGLPPFLNSVLQILQDLCVFPRFWWPTPLFASTFWTLQGLRSIYISELCFAVLQDLCVFPRFWWPTPLFASTFCGLCRG